MHVHSCAGKCFVDAACQVVAIHLALSTWLHPHEETGWEVVTHYFCRRP